MISALRQQQEKMHQLIYLVRHTPAVRSCMQRVFNEIVPASVQVQESGKDLTLPLQNFIGPLLAQFLEQALEMAYMCGFVVFVCKKQNQNLVPVLLPLGSFTWNVEVVSNKTKNANGKQRVYTATTFDPYILK